MDVCVQNRSPGKSLRWVESYGGSHWDTPAELGAECDVVFLAVSGDFSLEHAKAISDGDDGAVVIDNSVRSFHKFDPYNVI